MVSTRNAQKELDNLRSQVIGICKLGDSLYLVTKYNEEYNVIDSLRISELGAIHQDFGMPMRGKIELFPDNKRMTDMLNEPLEWAKFIGKFLAD